jgi:hypothetical protein
MDMESIFEFIKSLCIVIAMIAAIILFFIFIILPQIPSGIIHFFDDWKIILFIISMFAIMNLIFRRGE